MYFLPNQLACFFDLRSARNWQRSIALFALFKEIVNEREKHESSLSGIIAHLEYITSLCISAQGSQPPFVAGCV